MKNHTITKQLICLALAILTVISFSSCNNTPEVTENSESVSETIEIKKWDEFRASDYTIKKDGDNWYMFFDDSSLYDYPTGDIAAGLYFSSMDEWVEKVMKGKLTESEKHHIYKVFTDFKKGPIVCDFNNLYTPKLPSDLKFTGVSWLSYSYHFIIGEKDATVQDGYIYFYPLYLYNKDKTDYENYDPTKNDTVTITSENSSDRNSTIYYIGAKDKPFQKIIRYTISKDEQIIYITEKYYLVESDSIKPSPDIPYSITMFTSNGEYYMKSELRKLTKRPSVEYLSQFGAEYYVNTAYEGE